MATSSAPFSAGTCIPPTASLTPDALNRFRMSHSDKEVRALVRRLNRLPHAAESDAAAEGELARLEAEKWRFGVERQLAAVRSLQRQAGAYATRAADTAARNAELAATLESEKALLAKGLAEREQRIKCDEAAKRIVARGHSRVELEE